MMSSVARVANTLAPAVGPLVGRARGSSHNLYKNILICSILGLTVVMAACGGNAQEIVSDEPVTARVIVTNVEVSTDAGRVVSITVRTDDGRELPMRLADDIDPADWAPLHLQGHQGLGELGVKIGVTYRQTPEGIVATALSE